MYKCLKARKWLLIAQDCYPVTTANIIFLCDSRTVDYKSYVSLSSKIYWLRIPTAMKYTVDISSDLLLSTYIPVQSTTTSFGTSFLESLKIFIFSLKKVRAKILQVTLCFTHCTTDFASALFVETIKHCWNLIR